MHVDEIASDPVLAATRSPRTDNLPAIAELVTEDVKRDRRTERDEGKGVRA